MTLRPPRNHTSTPPVILNIDAYRDFPADFVLTLIQAGHEVLTAVNGQEAQYLCELYPHPSDPVALDVPLQRDVSLEGLLTRLTSPRKATADQNESNMAAAAVLDERSGSMKRSRCSEEQIVYAMRQAESGTPTGDLCRQLGVSEATCYTWKKKYAHLGVSELRRLRQVEEENARLKRLVADLSLDKHMLSEALRKKV